MAKKTTANKAVKRTQRRLTQKEQYKEVVAKRPPKKKSPEQLKLLTNPEDTPKNPLTWERLMNWLADTGWVEGFIRKKISPMDAHLIEDYTQSLWVTLLETPKDRMMEIWYHGKGAFVNYIKAILGVQLRCFGNVYRLNKHFHHTHVCLDDDQWAAFEEGNTTTHYDTVYPVKYNCPSGNRAKMVRMEHDLMDAVADYNDLIYNQIHSELLYEHTTKETIQEDETTGDDNARSEESDTELQEPSISDDDISR